MAKKLTAKAELAKLQKIWYGKLKKEGFNDIEANECQLKVWTNSAVSGYSQAEIDAKQIYYRLANHFLTEYEFETILDKVIWEYHVNGVGIRAIADELFRVLKVPRMGRQTVYRIIKRLQKIMYAKYKIEHNDDEEL